MTTPQPVADSRTQRFVDISAGDVPLAVPVDPTVPTAVPVEEVLPLPETIGNHEILGELGRGGMGVVYQARQKGLNRIVALKMVLDAEHVGGEMLARFRAEAEAVARLRHPNIVQIFEVGSFEGRPFFSLEYVEGGTLAQRIAGQPQPMRDAAALVEVLARAMHHAHMQGIVHRDLKPANVLLSVDGTPKITDFGLAKQLHGDSGQTRTGAVLGTPSYVAPEQAASKKGVGPPADVYALGAILYEMLTGRPPFKGETPMDTMLKVISDEVVSPSHYQPRVARDLETICLKCLQKDPGARYASADALGNDLRRYLGGEAIEARPVGGVERFWRWCRRKPLVAALLLLVLFLALGGVAGVMTQWLRAERNLAEADRQRLRAEASLAEAQKQRDLAEENYQQARKMVDEFFVKFSENAGLRGMPALQPFRKDLLNSALNYYTEFLKKHGTDPKLKAALADTYFRIGAITLEIGTQGEALAAFQKSRALYEELLAAEPNVARTKRGLASVHLGLARLHAQDGKSEDALRSYHHARLLIEEAIRAEPTNLGFQYDLVFLYDGMGNLYYRRGQIAEALRSYQQGRAFLEQSYKAYPSPRNRFYLALICKSIGSIYRELGQLAEARPYCNQALTLLDKLVQLEPVNQVYQGFRASLYIELGDFARKSGQPGEAAIQFEKARSNLEKLAHDNPGVTQYPTDLALAYFMIGELEHSRNRPAEAMRALEQARSRYEKLIGENPTALALQDRLALTLETIGASHLARGQTAEARRQLEAAYALLEKLTQSQPDHAGYRNHLARVAAALKQVRP